ncbi:hypothetical protein M407DRAFT_27979 [Tulasnella calospora MUT 4182]|uniref:Uncharacterized protein n=1 Tax=Tulasnella calospora MUT 4182 TaxID=1051891 RepID=A0A0C3LMB9_9AGAM|nr:hypothetical protein M407DRAFT_27979 [Tulasnella calospora MUT 4182]
MSAKPASLSKISLTGQHLLKSIESENPLPLGFLSEKAQQGPRESIQVNDPDELRACILATVDLLKHRLLETAAAVCRRHNSLLPVQRLPPEILSTCFGHAMTEIDSHNRQQRLIQLSNVSSWWHRVTLGAPSLWGVIHSKDPDWIVVLALERSKDATLAVTWYTASYKGNLRGGESYSIGAEDFFKLVSPHTNRWRDATLPKLGSGSTSID